MAYGMEIRTVDGLVSIDTIRSAQAVIKSVKTSSSGTEALPSGVLASQCVILTQVFDGNNPPFTEFSGGSVVWTGITSGGLASTNFLLLVLRYK